MASDHTLTCYAPQTVERSWLPQLAFLALLLLILGPIASLGGILLGELVILLRVIQMTRDWKRTHD